MFKKDDYFIIPNPIYDVIFKYLMEDKESAKIILSTLINENIIDLELNPLTHSEKIKDPKPESEQVVRLFHLDFTATIELPDGEKEIVMIELQKANEASDIFRFKRYIMKNFQQKRKKEVFNRRTKALEEIDLPIRLLPIFILNFRIENEINDLFIKSNQIKRGLFKEKEFKTKNDFIDHLTYDMIVIQLPNLSKIKPEDYENDEHKKNLYLLMKLFDQKAKTSETKHKLLLLRHEYPAFLKRVINRLRSIHYDEIENQMHVEDEYLSLLVRKVNEISFFKEKLEVANQDLEENKKILEEKNKVLEENKKILEEKDKILLKSAKMMKDSGISISDIHKITQLSEKEINNL